MNEKNTMLHDAIILFAITLIAGVLLGFVYELTKAPISKQEEAAKIAAYQEVFSDAASFEEVEFSKEEALAIVTEVYPKESIDEVMKALDSSGSCLGYVITATSNEAYDGSLQLSVGIRMDETINGISFLKLTESAGLGMEADPVLKVQFTDRKIENFVVTKIGASATNEIDAISGATITSRAVTNAVNASIEYFRSALGGGSNE